MTAADHIAVRADEFDDRRCEPMLLFWYVAVGEPVIEGQDLCEIETAKAVLVVTAPASGTLAEVCVAEGEAVESRQVLARIAPA